MTVENISIAKLCSTYAPLYPEGGKWDKTIQYMLNSEPDRNIILELMQVIQSGKTFRENVRVGLSASGKPSVLNGTHRVVAAILCESAFMRISFSDDEYVIEPSVEVRLSFQPSILKLINEDSLSSILFDYFRSIKVSDEIWLNSDVSSGSGLNTTFYYQVDDINENFLFVLSEKVISVLKQLQLLSFLDTITVQQEEIEDFDDEYEADMY